MAVTEPHQLYVRAAHALDQGGGITGTVLHLAVWALDTPGTSFPLGTGTWVPVCGGHGHPVQRWRWTGPWAEGWAGHAHWPLCRHCQRRVELLQAQQLAQLVRYTEHQDALDG